MLSNLDNVTGKELNLIKNLKYFSQLQVTQVCFTTLKLTFCTLFTQGDCISNL